MDSLQIDKFETNDKAKNIIGAIFIIIVFAIVTVLYLQLDKETPKGVPVTTGVNAQQIIDDYKAKKEAYQASEIKFNELKKTMTELEGQVFTESQQ